MLIDEPRQPLDRQAAVPDREVEFGRDRIALDAAMAFARQHIGPPLQADFTGQRLAHDLPDAGDLDIEGVDGEQGAALLGRHEQRRCVTGKIVAAHQFGAEFGRLAALVRPAHGTAIRAAATRRRSPIMML